MVMGQKMSVGVKVSIFNRLEYQLKKEQIRVLSILVQSSEKKRILVCVCVCVCALILGH